MNCVTTDCMAICEVASYIAKYLTGFHGYENYIMFNNV